MDNLLKAILLNLFIEHEFKIIDLDPFMFNSEEIELILALDNKLNEYYLGVSLSKEQLELLNSDLQIELMQHIKKIPIENPDKNTTLIILTDDLENTLITSIAIEEDPYFFKKHVLKINKQEQSVLNNRMSGSDSKIQSSLEETIIKTQAFEDFSSGNNDDDTTYYSIVAKLYEKFPFLQLPERKSEKLNLLENINDKLTQENLFNFKEKILELKSEEQINQWVDSQMELEND